MAIENWPETGRIPVYLVGGAVRDRLLGRTPREYDFAFDADEATFLQRNPEARKVGKSVSVFLLRGQEFMPLEGTLEEDMRRRDLTINALAEDRTATFSGIPMRFRICGRHPAALRRRVSGMSPCGCSGWPAWLVNCRRSWFIPRLWRRCAPWRGRACLGAFPPNAWGANS
ncbi:hypothetical protein [Bilophila wadsworthia]|uniref:hypothetical protein n=1 Tax=Bilophila wadsworthia TaxID=35833 RepID=UPI00399D20C7